MIPKRFMRVYTLRWIWLLTVLFVLSGCGVPNCVGMSQSAAEQAIRFSGLTVGVVTEAYSATAPVGRVIGQSPDAGEKADPGSAVHLIISRGDTLDSGPMIPLEACSFEMGDPWGWSSAVPVHTVNLSAYEIGMYDVTNQEYTDMLNWANAQGLLTEASVDDVTAYGQRLCFIMSTTCQIIYRNGQFLVRHRDGYSMADHPMVVVTWYGAAAYCNWLSEIEGLEPCYDTETWDCDFSKNGYHLPTEAQWELAAAWDGEKHWGYGTWSDFLVWGTANYRDLNFGGYANPLRLTDYPYTTPVGYYTDITSPVGCYDMHGNVKQWCQDWFDGQYYEYSPINDPLGPESDTGMGKSARGSSWTEAGDSHIYISANRAAGHPNGAGFNYGFRLARNP